VLGKVVLGIVIAGVCLGTSTAAPQDRTGSSQNTSLMQQMDHHRRQSEQRKADRADASPITGEVPRGLEEQQPSENVDYAIAGLLGVSGIALYAVYQRRRRSRRIRRRTRPAAAPERTARTRRR
jgi:hypothetical protein